MCGECAADGHTPAEAIRAGLALVTADRKAKGLNPPGFDRPQRVAGGAGGDCRPGAGAGPSVERAEDGAASRRRLKLKAPSLDAEAWQLSGGNQQKVVLARWMLTRPRVLLLDEPTRGVDVGAKEEIHKLIHQWTQEGMGIVLNSTEITGIAGPE